jgi:hypothetical protein
MNANGILKGLWLCYYGLEVQENFDKRDNL